MHPVFEKNFRHLNRCFEGQWQRNSYQEYWSEWVWVWCSQLQMSHMASTCLLICSLIRMGRDRTDNPQNSPWPGTKHPVALHVSGLTVECTRVWPDIWGCTPAGPWSPQDFISHCGPRTFRNSVEWTPVWIFQGPIEERMALLVLCVWGEISGEISLWTFGVGS